MRHPRERIDPSGGLTRREFLKRSAGAALALSGAGALLDACTNNPAGGGAAGGGGGTPTSLPLARPNHPVTWPIYSGNEPIASGLQPEQGATLQLYNWTDYTYKKVVNEFAA